MTVQLGNEMLCFHPLLSSLTVFLLSLDIFLSGVQSSKKEDVAKHIELGKKLLAQGQLADALHHYHEAVEGDPDNYMSYFQRATVFLAIGKSKSALPDLSKVIELKPDFNSARMQRGNILMKQGKLTDAKKDYQILLDHDPDNEEARNHVDSIPSLIEDKEDASDFYDQGDYNKAIELLSRVIEASPWDPSLREMRSECYNAIGDYFKAIGDIRPLTKLINDNTGAYLKLSLLLYQMGEADESLMEIRECLKLDQDHKQCHVHYKKVKKLVKQMNSVQNFVKEERWEDCVKKAKQMLETEGDVDVLVLKAKQHICHCESKAGNLDEAVDACSDVLDVEEDNIEAICDRAEAYLSNDKFDEAIADFQAAVNIDQNNQRASDGLHRAQKMHKQSQKRDYYKILNIKRNANKKQILKAYRKLAVIWHPDKYDGDDKKKAEKMFIDIAAAKEVLTDPEKRQKFDNGEDPLDPEQQSGGGGNPFWHQGFNPFGGGGGYSFKFHYN